MNRNLNSNIRVFEEYYNRLIWYAKRIVRSTDMAEDIVQDVFLKVVENNPILNDDTHRKNYYYRAVRNQSINVLAIEKKSVPFTEEWLDAVKTNLDNVNQDYEMVEWLQKTLQGQPPHLVEAFLRYALYDEKLNDLAKEMGMKPATLRQQIHRLRMKLIQKYLLFMEIISLIRIILVT